MSTARQHARMAAVRSVVASLRLRRHHLTSGYGLVVSGGAYAPYTNIESIAFADDDNSDYTELRPQRPPLSPPPCVPLGHCRVWDVRLSLAGLHRGTSRLRATGEAREERSPRPRRAGREDFDVNVNLNLNVECRLWNRPAKESFQPLKHTVRLPRLICLVCNSEEAHILAVWAATLISLLAWQVLWIGTELLDCVVAIVVWTICLPVIARETDPILIPALGIGVVGVATGFQCIDTGFDMLIIWERSLNLGDGLVIPGRQAAWMYYNTMLNSRAVNFGIEVFLVVSVCGSLVGLQRNAHNTRHKWMELVGMSCVGNGLYLLSVVPRYIDIRSSTAFQSEFFDSWSQVFFCRIVLFATLGASAFHLLVLLKEMNSKSRVSAPPLQKVE
ncbi:hypothetical protein CYMTET_18879 [Cymbomonas tetramitiformis]|uniref:Uncharacterized protein n=1 Tax=Cymbomonas tetramitiformis TaxID=36881 RepID=A0AAE0G7K1_9CHLO|nr:hypothetical protein CYMTET_18879 [Cymbomonas tetramitiformis]